MQTTKKFFILSFFLGALLFAGLFLFRFNRTGLSSATDLKPSKIDFQNGNQIQITTPAVEQIDSTELKTAIKTLKIDSFTPQDKSNWAAIESILTSKNDNDPRLDQELRALSPQIRNALYEKYSDLPAEDRSGRGMIVYLIARNMSLPEDIQFLKNIYQETPCLSLADCKSAAAEDPHISGTNQSTLIYPQLSALYLLDRQIAAQPDLLQDAVFRNGASQILAQAESFPVSAVHHKAREIRIRYGL